MQNLIDKGTQALGSRGQNLDYQESLNYGTNVPQAERMTVPTQAQVQARPPVQMGTPQVAMRTASDEAMNAYNRDAGSYDYYRKMQGTPGEMDKYTLKDLQGRINTGYGDGNFERLQEMRGHFNPQGLGQGQQIPAQAQQVPIQAQVQAQPRTRHNWGQ